ncbi:hypothetical protein LCGC14_2264060 [marine sediment metagenome]|uniref:Uncharacterized protein n=1 Tax=marine sediment metagenome TaxID=412755 RepID=A0A0F9FB93_9ZZZZ
MILSAREYAKKYAGNCSAKTVIRKAKRGLLPTNHKAKKVAGRFVIEIGELEHLRNYDIQLTRKSKQ